jgi:hypothetical protein
MKLKQKKGDIFQIFIMLIILIIVGIIGLLCLVLTTRVNTFWDNSGMLNGTVAGTNAINQIQDTAPKTTDYAILFLFIGLNIGILISAIKTNFHPATIVLFIFLVLIAIMISAGIVNMYQGLAQTPSIADVGSQLPFTNFLFSKYLPLIITVISAFVLILMYGKGSDSMIQ